MMKSTSFRVRLGIHTLNVALLCGTMLTVPAMAQEALPTGGQVVSGSATISTAGSTMTVNQSSDRVITNWQSFNIGADNTVTFNQPTAQSVALNRVIGQDPSQILGRLTANGQVFLLNPNGIVIGKQGSVQTGGFVGSTLNMTDADFQSGNYRFTGTGGTILNQGDLKGGVVALIAPRVTNEGTITGNTALAAGTDVTLDFAGDGLLSVEVDAATLATLVENKGLIQADGGVAILTARGASDALKGVVNNTGTVEAASLESRDGRILLLGDMDSGEVNAGGTLQASFVETSAATVNIADDIQVKTGGGQWLIDPNDFVIAASGGNMTGAAITNNLVNGNVEITTLGRGGEADIVVNDSIIWSSHTLTLDADRNIYINAPLYGSGTAGLTLEYAQRNTVGDYYINAPVNLASTGNFTTWENTPSGNLVTHYTIITSLGAQGSSTGTDLQGINQDLSGNYVLGSDIDATTTANWNNGEGFRPIGNVCGLTSCAFRGIFNGLGHTISNLSIRLEGLETPDGIGLFAEVRGGKIENVHLTDVSLSGRDKVGGLAGIALDFTEIRNTSVTGAIAGNNSVGGLIGYLVSSNITYSSSSAMVSRNTEDTGINFDFGGLVGLMAGGDLSRSYATGDVSGRNAGGLVGGLYGSGTIRESYATGNVTGSGAIGGLVGSSIGKISDSFATGTVTRNGSGSSAAGGLIGEAFGGGTITRSFAVGDVHGESGFTGGLVGIANSTSISDSFFDSAATGQTTACGIHSVNCSATGLTTAQMKDPATFTAAGWDFTNVWAIDPAINNGYPYLRATVASTVTPPPPPPPPPVTLTVSDIASFTTSTAPYQPPITLTGTGFGTVTEVRFSWTDPNGQTGTVTWNAANSFGGGRFVPSADGNSATIAPVLVASGDPSGTYQWSVTFFAGTQSVTKSFTVSYSGVVVPPPPPPPVALTVTSGIGDVQWAGPVPYVPTFTVTGTGLNSVSRVTLSWTGPGTNNSGTAIWDGALDGFDGGKFVPSATGTSATLRPTLLATGDAPGPYYWTITFTNGGTPVTRSFTVTYGAAALEEPVVSGISLNPTSNLLLGGTNAAPLYVNTSSFLTNIPATPQNIEAAQQYAHYAIMANNVYNDNQQIDLENTGWELAGNSNSLLGTMLDFYAETYVHRDSNGNIDQVTISFRGTNSANNWFFGNVLSSSAIGTGIYAAADQYFNEINETYQNIIITTTGHSMGGALSTYISKKYETNSVVFNTSPMGGSSGTRIEELGDPLAVLRNGNETDITYSFVQDNDHGITNLALGMLSLINGQ